MMGNTKTILIVEDDKDLLNIAVTHFRENDIAVFTADNTKEAWKVLKKQNIDAIWLDHYLLGKQSGLDLLVRLKNDDEYKIIPVYVVSNTAGPKKRATYISLGVEKFYTKIEVDVSDVVMEIIEKIKES